MTKLRRLLAFIVSLTMMLTYVPAAAPADPGAEGNHVQLGHDHSDGSWTAWGNTQAERTSLPTTSGKYYLTADVTVSARHRLESKDIELCLNGHSITSTATAWGSVYQLYGTGASSLKLENCKDEGEITRTVTANNALMGTSASTASESVGSIELINLTFNGIKGGANGSFITVQGTSALTATGCTFKNCESTGNGGVLFASNSAESTFKNCTFSGCKGGNYGVVYMTNTSKVTLDGCSVTGCSGRNAVIYSNTSTSLTLNSTRITGNSLTAAASSSDGKYYTGAVYSLSNNVTLGGSNVIKNNTDSSGAADFTMQKADGTFKVTGAGDDTEVAVKYVNDPTGTYIATVTGGLKGSWTWINDSTKVLAENANHQMIIRDAVNVTGVTVDPSEVTIEYGESSQLTAQVIPAEADNKAVRWKSSDINVATVDENGLVTAVGSGPATITATSVDGGKEGTCSVTVPAATIPVTGISVTNESLVTYVGSTLALTAVVEPAGASDKTVTWTSQTPAVASVDNYGVVTGITEGTASITAASSDPAITTTVTVTVRGVHEHDSKVYTGWTSGTSLPTDSGVYFLDTDSKKIDLAGTWVIPAGATIELCLNGHTINAPADGRAVTVLSGAALTLSDVHGTPGVITGGSHTYGGAVNVNSGATFNMYDITLTGNESADSDQNVGGEGGAVYIQGGTSTRDGGVFNMYSGSITGNSAPRGAAIMAAATSDATHEGAKVNILGGSITDNTAGTKHGGAVYGGSRSVINVTDAEISGNTTGGEGGAMYLTGGAGGTLKNAVITGNGAKNGSAIVILGGDLVIEDSQITDNNATAGFGALHITRGNVNGASRMAVVTLRGATKITGNTRGKTDTAAGTPQNVMLRKFASGLTYSYVYVDAAGLSGDAMIGVSLEKGSTIDRYQDEDGLWITAENDSVPDGSEAFFTADNPDYEVINDNGRLKLQIPPTVPSIHDHAGDEYTLWTSSTSLPTASGKYGLDGDVTLDAVWNIPNNADITLCLNGHNITAAPGTTHRMVTIGNFATLTINDCSATPGTISGGSSRYGGGVQVKTGATFNLEAGILSANYSMNGTDSSSGGEGGAVYVQGRNNVTVDGTPVPTRGGVFNMTGGEISGNFSNLGAAVHVYGFGGTDIGSDYEPGTANISGGKISGNTANGNGSAVYVRTMGIVNITGGTIENNTTGKQENVKDGVTTYTLGNGGAIYAGPDSVLNIVDCAITGNTTENNGGAVYISARAAVTIERTQITGNNASASSAVWVSSGASLALSDSQIKDNTFTNGAGVYASADTTVTLGGATVITGNKAGSADVNLFLAAGVLADPLTLTDGAAIAVTPEVSPAAVSVAGADAALPYFTSDNAFKFVVLKEGQIWIDEDSDHKHCACGTGTAGGCAHEVLNWYAWDKTDSLPTVTGNYYLTADVTLGAEQITKNDSVIGLCLNGHNITGSGSARLIRVGIRATLTITDCQGTPGTLSGGSSTYGAGVRVQSEGVFNMYGGVITGNESTADEKGSGSEGGGVYVLGRTVAKSGDTTVNRNGGVFNMYGGKITGNKAGTGSAITVYGFSGTDPGEECTPGTVNIYGGEISGNSATTGTVYVRTNAVLNAPGAAITGNTSEKSGSAVYLQKNASATLGGEISGNTAGGNGAVNLQDGASLTLDGAKITGNTAAAGAGIYANASDTSIVFKGATVVKDNKAAGRDENLFLGGNSVVDPSGLTDGASIGVTISGSSAVISTPDSGSDAGYFFSDSSYKDVSVSGGLIVIGANSGHRHCACAGVGGGCSHEDADFAAWEHADSLPTSEGYYYLTSDVTLSAAAVVAQGAKVVLCLNGHTVRASESRIYTVAKKSTLIISDCSSKAGTLTGGLAAYGGAVNINRTGTFTLYAGTIRDCTVRANSTGAGLEGGAVYMQSGTDEEPGGTFNMYGGTITGCSAQYGGAIRMGGGTSAGNATRFNMYGGEIAGNEAQTSGGGIYAGGHSAVLISGGTVSGNNVVGGEKGGNGGGIYMTGGTTLRIDSGAVRDNTAAANGGGIAAAGTDTVLTLTGGSISGNSARNGAGILAESKASVRLTGGSITGNKAQFDGAGAYISTNCSLTFSGGEISGNKADRNGGGLTTLRAFANFSGGSVKGNGAGSNGGGVFISGAEATFSGTEVSGNTAKGNGGGAMITTASYKVGEEAKKQPSTVSFTGGTFRNNKADNAGGILVQGADSRLNMTGGSVTDNSAAKGGGGVYISTNTSFEMTGGSISGNSSSGDGAGLTALRSKVSLRGGSISNNSTAASGGGIKVLGASVSLRGTTVSGNTAKVNGGGVRSCNIKQSGETFVAHLYMSSGSVSGNKAEHGGGLLIEQKDSSFELSGGRITGNSASVGGGGLYVSTGTRFNMSGGTIAENTTEGSGGGVYVLRNDAVITGGEITGNKSVKGAGGIMFSSSIQLKNVCTVSGLKVTDNEAKSGAGMVVQGRVTVNAENITVTGNKASGSGGGIYFSVNSWLNIKGSTIENNTAEQDGGGIYENIPAILNVEDTVISGNSAVRNGGGFFSRGSNRFTNVTISGNSAGESGGGAGARKSWYNLNAADWFERPYQEFYGCTFTDNTAKDLGGGLWLDLGTFGVVQDCVFTGNEASQGSAMSVIDEMTMKSVTATGNRSTGGAAVYLAPSAYDGYSYFTGIIKMSGNMKIYDNVGMDLYMDEQTVALIDEEGLGDDARIELTLDSGLVTNRLYGSYNYEGGDQKYTITRGDRSLTEPEYDPAAVPDAPAPEDPDGPTEAPTGEAPADEGGSSATPWIIGGIAGGAVAAAAVAIMIFRKKSKKEA